jgi:preprotein translocase subunit SecG
LATYVMLVQILISIALIALVLMQTRGEGFSATFSADSSIFRTRRGVEKTLFQLTIGVGVLFVIVSIWAVWTVRG